MRKIKIKDFHKNPFGIYKCPDYVIALVSYLIDEVRRVYWNINQKEWDGYHETGLPGLKIRYYCSEDEKEAEKPNFKFKEVEIRWYKDFGRNMTVNIKKTEKQWVKWFNDCLNYIRSSDDSFY